MLRNWRVWILFLLLLGPVLLYIALGFLWLTEHRGPLGFRGELVFYATMAWILTYALFSYLASRWTNAKQSLLPPLDWDSPSTFTDLDRRAWDLVQEQADRGDLLPLESLSGFDVYIDTGRSLARELARLYQPNARDPIEHVPILDMLTAMQLAVEDLTHLLREVPAGDLVTPGHWKRAVQAAGYIQRANEIYTFLLPMFQPAAGLVRLGTQKLMVQPAWKNIQQNLMRWFYHAYINRLGTHLIELYSGRLVIGAEQYRRMSKKWAGQAIVGEDLSARVRIGIAGARGAGKSALHSAIDRARSDDLKGVRDRLRGAGMDESIAASLRDAELREVPGYTLKPAGETARDRSTRRQAVREAAETDLILLAIDGAREDLSGEARFLEELAQWFAARPRRSPPAVLAVITGVDRPDLPGGWSPPYDWRGGQRPRETWVRKKIEATRARLGELVIDVVPVSLHPSSPYGVSEWLLPEVAVLLHRAERAALLRHLGGLAGRSTVGRVLTQVGRQGRRLLQGIRPSRVPAGR